MIRLIDIIDILSNNHKIKIGLNGDYIGTFTKDYIEYRFLTQKVISIYPVTTNDTIYICVDLVTE